MNQTTTQIPARPQGHLAALYGNFAWLAGLLQSPLLLGIRIYIGYQCAISGLGHLHHFNQTVDQFKEWKIPHPEASVRISATTELVGGTLLLAGLAARLVSIPLIFNFLVAMIQTDLAYPGSREKLFHLWDDQSIILQDTAFPFFVAAVLILVFGPGWFSVDGLVKFFRRTP
jgi:putative oxidoreductase